MHGNRDLELRRTLAATDLARLVDDLRDSDLEQLDWSGDAAHLEAVATALERRDEGEVDYLVIRSPGGRPVAKAGIDYIKQPEAGTIWQVATHPHCRRLGLAATLMVEAEARIRSRGLRRARVDVEADNLPARRLYRSLGYRTIGSEDVSWDIVGDEGHRTRYETTVLVLENDLEGGPAG
jgi:ribosomal protein S18 acetylase RimI-like enzyme